MGKGGWRYGAGRPGWRQKIEQCPRLDVGQLARRRMFASGTFAIWRWSNSHSGEESGSVAIRGEHGRIVLNYSSNDESVSLPIYLTTTPCSYCGSRPWFVCPRCGRRCGVVAFSGGRWACRVCLKLAYSSEADDTMGRLWRRQRKLEVRIGENWEKPKGMHWATFSRIWESLADIEWQKDEQLMIRAVRFFGPRLSL